MTKEDYFSTYVSKSSDEIYLLTVCNKSFRVVKNTKLSAGNVRLGGGFVKLEELEPSCFEKMFQKQEKLFIQTDCAFRVSTEHVLVFDTKKDIFYFQKNKTKSLKRYKDKRFSAGRDGKVYALGRYYSQDRM